MEEKRGEDGWRLEVGGEKLLVARQYGVLINLRNLRNLRIMERNLRNLRITE